MERRRKEGKEDVPRITTFLTSLLAMRTSDPDLSSLLPRRGHVLPLSSIFMIMVVVIIFLVFVVFKTMFISNMVSMIWVKVVRGGEGGCPV